jgi:hypothetical protein
LARTLEALSASSDPEVQSIVKYLDVAKKAGDFNDWSPEEEMARRRRTYRAA